VTGEGSLRAQRLLLHALKGSAVEGLLASCAYALAVGCLGAGWGPASAYAPPCLRPSHHQSELGAFGGAEQLAPLCALLRCTVLWMVDEDDSVGDYAGHQMVIYKPSEAALLRSSLGRPIMQLYGSKDVRVLDVTAEDVLEYLDAPRRPTTIIIEYYGHHCSGYILKANERFFAMPQASLHTPPPPSLLFLCTGRFPAFRPRP